MANADHLFHELISRADSSVLLEPSLATIAPVLRPTWASCGIPFKTMSQEGSHERTGAGIYHELVSLLASTHSTSVVSPSACDAALRKAEPSRLQVIFPSKAQIPPEHCAVSMHAGVVKRLPVLLH